MNKEKNKDIQINLATYHHKNLSNPLVILLGSVSIFFLTQIMSGFVVLPFKTFINNDNLLSVVYVAFSGLVLFSLLSLVRKIISFSWSSIGWKKPNKRDILRVLPALFLYIFISMALTALATKFIPSFNVEQAQKVGFDQLKKPLELFLAFIALSVITPMIEETIFRGILFKGLRRKLPFWFSAVITSIIFATAHMQWNVAVDTFALSLILCYLVEKSGSVVPAILLHALKNTLAFVFLFIFK